MWNPTMPRIILTRTINYIRRVALSSYPITGKTIGGQREAVKLLDLPEQEVKDWLNTFDSVLSDCDGVLWLYNDPIECSVETINKFIDSGKKVYLITNNSTKTREEYLEKAINFGYKVNVESIISTAHVAANYLKRSNFSKSAYIVGSKGIEKELKAVGIKSIGVGPEPLKSTLLNFVETELKPSMQENHDIGAVVVGFDEHISFPKMARATAYLRDPNCLFVATNTDEQLPMSKILIPGTGTMVRAIETGAERKPIVMGKPNKSICQHLIDDKIISPERTLMIGDKCNTDILLGTNCGFQTLLVGSGVHSYDDVLHYINSGNDEEKGLIPDAYLPTLGDLLQFMNM